MTFEIGALEPTWPIILMQIFNTALLVGFFYLLIQYFRKSRIKK